jgi:hypothetical protein
MGGWRIFVDAHQEFPQHERQVLQHTHGVTVTIVHKVRHLLCQMRNMRPAHANLSNLFVSVISVIRKDLEIIIYKAIDCISARGEPMASKLYNNCSHLREYLSVQGRLEVSSSSKSLSNIFYIIMR